MSQTTVGAGGGAAAPAASATSLGALSADLLALLKPRVMSLVVFTALVGYVLAPGPVQPLAAAVALALIAMAAGACGAINMWYDADIDSLMQRTACRPVPAGRLRPRTALLLGVALAALSVAAMAALVNLAAAALLAATVGFYVFVYTMWLKRRTPLNVVIGGAAGALPPVVGWAAASGGLDWGAVALFAIILVWTPPHSWALALCRLDDYARAGVPMLPVAAGRAAARRQILIYSIVLAPLGLLPWALGIASPVYAAVAGGLGAIFVRLALAVRCGPQDDTASAGRLFGYSILYLFLLQAALLLGRL